MLISSLLLTSERFYLCPEICAYQLKTEADVLQGYLVVVYHLVIRIGVKDQQHYLPVMKNSLSLNFLLVLVRSRKPVPLQPVRNHLRPPSLCIRSQKFFTLSSF